MVVLLTTLILDLTILVFVCLLVTFLETVSDLTLKKMFTMQMLNEWVSNIKFLCTTKVITIGAFLLFIILLPMAYDANERATNKKNNACVCNCERCKDVSNKVDAIVKYLALDDEDINDILKPKKKED